MKTTWKGYLKFSMVTIPIKMYNAILSKQIIHFNMLHEECKTRIKHQNYCPKCEKALTIDKMIRGYRYGKDKYIPITDEELAKAQKEATNAIEIFKFVDDNQIHPVYYHDSNYIVPDGKVAFEAFSLFHKAIEISKKAALAKVVMKNKEYLLSIKPYNGVLVAFNLHYPEEIQKIGEIEEFESVGQIKVDNENLSLAIQIIKNLSGDFKPEELVDEYSETLMDIIKAKAEGKEYTIEREEREKVVNLMDALKKSVKETAEMPRKVMAIAGRKKISEKNRKTA